MKNKYCSYNEYTSKNVVSPLKKMIRKSFSKLGRNTIFPQLRLWAFRRSGNKIEENVFIGAECYLDDTFPELITIEKNVIISFRVMLIAHKEKAIRGTTEVAPIHIKENVFIGAGAIILPGVIIGHNSVVGAGAVVTKNVQSNVTVTGIPAKQIDWKSSHGIKI